MKPVASVYNSYMGKILVVYKRGGSNITKINYGNKFCKVMDPFLEKHDLPIKMNYAAAQGYVPRAEKIIHDIRKGV